ncbi:MAG TPA: YbaB/EbfC family nucleoid-associated protein [Planctomycetota bacterium]|jgi:DNA-binding YbaB/EbfC family protein|nr:YbaB/EbfC family nucleoid-associated protein [Planctomycetota bacterium]
MKGFDPNALFNQAKKLKDEMEKVQTSLKERMVEGQSAGGLVSVVANGNQQIEAIRINPGAVNLDDLSELEDLVLVAVRSALDKAKELHEREMAKVTGGMSIPGIM